MKSKSLKDFELANKTVLLRVDFNVPVDNNNIIKNAAKIKQSLPTIKYLLKQKAKVILLSHRSEIKGSGIKPSFKPLVKQISKIIGKKIHFLNILDIKKAEKKITGLKQGSVVLFENTRHHPGEEVNDEKFAKDLAGLGHYFVYDAFPSHRPEVSTVGLTKFIPSLFGFSVQKEVEMLTKVTKDPKKPFVAIIGGAKTEIKVGLVDKFIETADSIILGGAVANTFLKAMGINLGKSLVDDDMIPLARKLLQKAERSNVKVLLPEDVVVAHHESFRGIKIKHHSQISSDEAIFDIGPETLNNYDQVIKTASTIVWNGPLGKYEHKAFVKGSKDLLSLVAKYNNVSIIGGGDTLELIDSKLKKNITYVSTAGGAMLKFLEKGTTAPVEAILQCSFS